MEVIRLEPSNMQQAALVYSRAFFDYPQFTCYFPGREWRTRHLQSYCEVGLRSVLRYGELYATPDLKGVIGWFAPGKTHAPAWSYLTAPGALSKLILIGRKNISQIIASEQYAGKVHTELMPDPHWFLWGLAVDPDCQGQGIGTSLMEPGIKRGDQQGLPIYLETHEEKNVAYYQDRGFELVRTDRVPGIGLAFWCLVRLPEA